MTIDPATLVHGVDTCSVCPRLCRPACPVASGSGREAAVPALIAATLVEWRDGRLLAALAAEAATLCTDCGACQAHCHIDRPLPEILRRARAELVACPPMEPLRPIEGQGATIAVEADERPLAAALARHLGRPIRRWVTRDRLGVAAVEHREWASRAVELRAWVEGVEVVVADGGVAHALAAAGVPFRWLVDLVPALGGGIASCRAPGASPPTACCGAGGPLQRHHPEDALRVGRFWLTRATDERVADARCREHLRACGGNTSDPLDLLLRETRVDR